MPLPWERDWGLAGRVEQQESGGNQNAVSPKGAFGVMQLMPDTARDPGFGVAPLDPNASDPEAENRRVGTDYLNAMLSKYGGNKAHALVAYNWGPGNADKWIAEGADTSRLPAETQGYVRNILGGEGPQLGAVGARPWERKWNVPQEPKRAYPNPSHGGDLTLPPEQQPLSGSEWGDDLARSAISGTASALTGLAGLPGDIQSLGNRFEHWLNPEIQRSQTLPTSEDAEKWVRENIGDFSYDPKSETGKIVQKTALYGGSGAGAGARTLAKGAVQTAATGLGAHVGQEVGGDVGEVVGAIAGSRFGSRPTVMGRAPKPTAADTATAEADNVISPATAAVRRTSQEAYTRADNSGVVVRGQPFAEKLNQLKANPKYDGLKIPGDTFRMAPKDLTVAEFDDIRSKLVKTSMRDPDPNKRRLAGEALNELDDFFENPRNIGVGNSKEAAMALRDARKNWKIYRKSEMLDQIMESARDRAGQYSVSGNENAIRTGFRQLSTKINRDKRTRNLFTKDEIALIRQLSRGGRVRDLFKNVGAVLNARTMQGIGGLAVGGAQAYSVHQGQGLDPWSAILGATIYGVGKGSRAIGGAMAKSKANQLRKTVRAGGQMTSTPGDFRPAPMAGTLLGLKNSLGF